MMEISSLIDATLALMGAAAVLATSIWTVLSQSTTVSTVGIQREAETPTHELRKAA